MELLPTESRIPRMVKLYYFESTVLCLTIKIQYDYIHKICEKVLHRIKYKKKIVEMALFQKYEVLY